jgi:hypothetical protein
MRTVVLSPRRSDAATGAWELEALALPDAKDNEASADSDDNVTAPPRSPFCAEPGRDDEDEAGEDGLGDPFGSVREGEEEGKTAVPF